MRRKDREKDEAFAIDVIKKCEYGVIAMVDDGKPYCVPISPVYLNNNIYFHSALNGRKCSVLEDNKNVCLSFVCDTELIPLEFSTKYKSAIVFGECSLVINDNEKTEVLLSISRKYATDDMKLIEEEIRKNFTKTAIYKVIPTLITGKGRV